MEKPKLFNYEGRKLEKLFEDFDERQEAFYQSLVDGYMKTSLSREQAGRVLRRFARIMLQNDEIFHIIHKAIWLTNEKRPANDQIAILDKEIGYAEDIIAVEDF